MNTTPIERCVIGAHAELTVKLAKEKGWSNFSIFPNGSLWATSPEGIETVVPNYAQTLKDAAPDLLAALKSCVIFMETAAKDTIDAEYAGLVLRPAKAAIASAEGEAVNG